MAGEARAVGAAQAAAEDAWFDRQCPRITLAFALAAITAVGAYFCFVHGFPMLDQSRLAHSTLMKFGAYTLVYSGCAFSIMAVVNALYFGAYKAHVDEPIGKRGMCEWTMLNVAAPVAILGFAACLAGSAALEDESRRSLFSRW